MIILIKKAYRYLCIKMSIRKNVTVGDNFSISSSGYITAPEHLIIGRDVTIGRNCWIACNGRIGNGVLISSYVGIAGRYDHNMREIGVPISRSAWIYDVYYDEKSRKNSSICIEDDVWIGFGAIILSGVTVGASSVIAAGALVVNDVPENSIYAGIPAKLVGERFSADDYKKHKTLISSRYNN